VAGGKREAPPVRLYKYEVEEVEVVVELDSLSSAACRGDGGTGGGEGGGSSGWSSSPSLLLFSVYGKVGRYNFRSPMCLFLWEVGLTTQHPTHS